VNGAPLFEGDDILYTLQITNTGTYTAFDVTVTDDLPDEVILTSHSTDLDSVSGTDPLVWTILELPASTVATLYLTVTVEAGTSGQSITNTAMVSGTNLSPAPDPPDPVCPDGSRVVGGQCSIGPVPVVDFSSNTFSVGEAAGTSLITVTLATSSALTTTVNYATSTGSAVAGSDYITSIGTLTFDPGVTSQVFDVTVVDDSFDEIDETITLTLSSPQNAALGGNNPATLTIVDNDYSLVSHVVGNGTVLTNPLKTAYTFGEVVTLTATADPGSSFANWSGDLSGSTSPITLTMTAGKEVTATFTQDQYALQIATVGSGWVLTNPAQAAYDFGEVVTLTAFADFGWTFGGWSGDLAGSNSPDTVTITGDTAVTGTFIQEAYTLAITTVGGGAVVTEPAKVSYSYGEVVTLTATADPGWTFGGWSGDLTGSNSPDTVTITGDMAITGTFTQEAYTLAITTVGGGTVVTEPAKVSYSYGEVVTLTGTADPGWTFAGWSGDLSGLTSPETISMTSARTITATFSAGSTVLELSKTALDIDGPPLFVTDTIRYMIQVTNSGSIGITALNVVVTDTLPVSVTLVSSDASQGTTSGTGQLVWDVGDLLAGGGLATMVVTVTLLVGTEDQSIINYVTVGADNANSSTIEVCPDSGTPSDGVCAARPQVPDQAEQEGVYIPIVIK
jgi:uncharacterized repeat protein (TIGR01451 family)/uncharacterized repeat protein (TIGR02543 family)